MPVAIEQVTNANERVSSDAVCSLLVALASAAVDFFADFDTLDEEDEDAASVILTSPSAPRDAAPPSDRKATSEPALQTMLS